MLTDVQFPESIFFVENNFNVGRWCGWLGNSAYIFAVALLQMNPQEGGVKFYRLLNGRDFVLPAGAVRGIKQTASVIYRFGRRFVGI